MLSALWRFLERRPAATAVMAEWKMRLGETLPAALPLLRPLEALAKIYPAATRNAAPLRIVRHRDQSAVAVSEDGDRLTLTHADQILHRIDPRALRKAIADALPGIAIARTPAESFASPILIGHWEPKKSAAFPLWLIACSSADVLQRRMMDLANTSGAMLLTPTRMHWTASAESLAKSRKLLLISADEILSFTQNRWCATAAWDEYLQAFCQLVQTSLPANLQNKRPLPQRAARTADIEKLEKALEAHLRAARDHAFEQERCGREMTLLPRPEQKDLARLLELTVSKVSRCLNDPRAVRLQILWQSAASLEQVLKFKR